MIELFQFPPFWGLPNVSPFCLKMETYLRMVKLPFHSVYVQSLGKAPKGKCPYIRDGDLLLGDTDFIITYLKEKYGDPLDKDLSLPQRAQSLALQRLIEEHLYWVGVYSRWLDPVNWLTVKETFFGKVPFLIRTPLANVVRRKLKRDLYGQGMGRHSQAEIYALGIKDLQALDVILSAQPFLLGEAPTSIDATGYAFLASLLDVPIQSPLQAYAQSTTALSRYCARMRELYY